MTNVIPRAPGRICVFDVSEGGRGPVVLQASSRNGASFQLVATNGEERWEGPFRYSEISELMASNAPVTRSEWEFILDAMFDQALSSDIVVKASIVSEQSLTLTVRKQTRGITQRLGAITIPYDIDGETDVVAWCALAARSAAEAKSHTVDTNAQLSDLKAEVKDLKKQLDELVQAKQDDETVLLHKFRDLLNEKKVKIREQHKVISSASFRAANQSTDDPEPSQTPVPVSKPSTKRKPAPSRVTKRKVTQRAVESASEEDGFENMDMDMDMDEKVKDEPLDDEDPETGQNTTASDEMTASEDDDEDEVDRDKTAQERTNSASRAVGKGTGNQSKQVNQPPPPRSLPFSSKNQLKAAPQLPKPVGPGAGSDSESDDEL